MPDSGADLLPRHQAASDPAPGPYIVSEECAALGLRVKATYEATALLVQDSTLQMMELLHRLRTRYLPHESHFLTFVKDYVQVIEPQRALQMAEAWPALSANRPLRDLARRDPDGAINTFMALGQLREGAIAEDDVELLKLTSMPPRRRNRALRQLLADAQGAPAAALREEVAALKAERDELARNVPPARLPAAPTLTDYMQRYNKLLGSIDEFVDWSAEAASVIDLDGAAESLRAAWHERLLDMDREFIDRVRLLQQQWIARDG